MSDPGDGAKAIRRLYYAFNKIDGAYYFCAKKMGIKENTLALLYALDDGEPHTQKQISRDWLIPKTTISSVVKELTQSGHLTLSAPEHGKEKAIALTPKGKEYTQAIMKEMAQAEQEALRKTLLAYPPEFIEAFGCFAGHLCDEFEQRILGKIEQEE